MVRININIQKKDLWLISAIFVFLVGVGVVVAYDSGGPASVVGHSFEEIELPNCADGEVLKYSTTNGWECGSGAFNPSNCEWVDVVWENGDNFCPFGKIVQGINVCARDGHRDVCKLNCCDLV